MRDDRACIDCRSCRFFFPCEQCKFVSLCRQHATVDDTGCCNNPNHTGMSGCWCPKNYGCPQGQYTDEMIEQLKE